jgi:hypothetical protein
VGLSFDALLLSRASNAWTVGASNDDVSTLSTLGGVVQIGGTTTDALPPGMVRTSRRFWPWRLLHRRWLVRERQLVVGQEGSKVGKLDNLECQTGPSGFS